MDYHATDKYCRCCCDCCRYIIVAVAELTVVELIHQQLPPGFPCRYLYQYYWDFYVNARRTLLTSKTIENHRIKINIYKLIDV